MPSDRDQLPRVHSICLVKNEADIVRLTLERALAWSHRVLVLDNGSTDGTWEVVQRLARDDPRVVAWKQDHAPFRESLRGDVYNAFRQGADADDWWCRLDADEIYVEDPRLVLRRVARRHHVVWGIALEYYLTPEDVERIDFSRPIEQILPLIRGYKAENSEPRFFRHRARLRWAQQGWPDHMGLSAPQRVPYRHYKYRSPHQIQRRLDTRREAIARGFQGWGHARGENWREKLAAAHSLQTDRGEERFQIDERRLPDHLGSLTRRAIKGLLHGLRVWP